jgi:hypothetical protein
LLTADAHQHTGQALSRLLNVMDGMLGQTSNPLFLITTNEPVSSFHEAVARPGRCASLVEFLPLPAASAWPRSRGATSARPHRPPWPRFGVVAGTPMPRKPRGPLGFALAAVLAAVLLVALATPAAASASVRARTPDSETLVGKVRAGHAHSCGIHTNGTAALPEPFVSLSGGRYHTCGVGSDAVALCWGDNFYGQSTPPSLR